MNEETVRNGLTSSQQNIWNLQTYYEETTISTIAGAILFEETIENTWIQRALNRMLSEQEGFRLRFFTESGMPYQTVTPYQKEVFPEYHFTDDAAYQAFVREQTAIPLTKMDAPMYRFFICQFEAKTAIFVILSHLIADAWTLGIFAERTAALIASYQNGEELQNESHTYVTHIENEQQYFTSKRFQKDEVYWKTVYEEKPDVSYIKPERGETSDIRASRFVRELPRELTARIRDFCAKGGHSPAAVFETAMCIYLGKLNPEASNITIGTPVLNRQDKEERHIVGMFIATAPMTVGYREDMRVSELLRAARIAKMNVLRHQQYPYAKIQSFLREKHQMTGNLYDVMVSFQNAKISSELPFHTEWYSNGYSETALVLHIDDRDANGGYRITIDYQTAVFRDETEITLVYDRLCFVLAQLIESDARCVDEISILPERERQMLINDFNDTYVAYPREKCVHELFMEQAARTPEQTALVFEDKQFTYRQLDEMSNALAHLLRDKGIGRGDIVPIISVRSWHIIVAMLGILKAGGAYMPISPDYPRDRIEYILKQAGCKLLLLYGCRNDEYQADVIDIEGMEYHTSTNTPDNINESNDPCYVIYTSGSTGEPKGCLLTHRGIVNFCRNNNILEYCRTLDKQIFLCVNPTIFDYFIAETLLPLLNGYMCVLANERECISQDAVCRLVEDQNINIIQTTPTRYKLFMTDESELDWMQELDIVVSSGEPLTQELLDGFLQNTNAKIYNPLGPSECSVWVAGGEI